MFFSDYEAFSKDPANKDLSEYEKGWKYISKQYQVQFAGTIFHAHLTCALDSEQCQKVFQVVQDSIFSEAIDVAGL